MYKVFLIPLLCTFFMAVSGQSSYDAMSIQKKIELRKKLTEDPREIKNVSLPERINHKAAGKIINRGGKTEKLDSITQFEFDELGNWREFYKNRLYYSENNLLIFSDFSSLNIFSGEITPDYGEEYIYDEASRCIEEKRLEWLSPGYWGNSSRRLYTYSPQNKITSLTYESWDPQIPGWDLIIRDTFLFSAAGSLIEEITYQKSFSTGEVQETYRSTYAYNTSQELTLQTDYFKSEESNSWEPYTKIEYKYNSHGETERIISYWSVDQFELDYKVNNTYDNLGNLQFANGYTRIGASWVPEYEYRFVYDDMDRLINREDYDWDPFSFEWIGAIKLTNTYSDFDDVVEETYFEWDESTGTWIGDGKILFTFDEDIDTENLVLPIVDQITDNGFVFNKKVLSADYFSYDNLSKEWDQDGTSILHYSGITTSADKVINNPKMIFPNPASNEILIELENLSVDAEIQFYSLDGKQVFESKILKGQPVSVRHAPPGIYIYKITSEQVVYSGKLMIVH